jgi:LPXTG-site transpeptidase (sortase) family protein
VDESTLRTAVGHVPGTAFPGETGRIALAAHRDTFFRNLKGIKTSDIVRLQTRDRVFEYRVVGTEIVNPDRIQVIAPTREPRLTLITCYPFSYVGRAPLRFIVHADPLGAVQPTAPVLRAAQPDPPRKPALRPRRTHGEPFAAVVRPAEEGIQSQAEAATGPALSEPAEQVQSIEGNGAVAAVDQTGEVDQPSDDTAIEAKSAARSGKVARAVTLPFRKAFGWIR